MDQIRDALLRLYKAAKISRKLAHAMDEYDTPYHDIYGNLADGIYYMLGEHTDSFKDSITYLVLTNDMLLEERAVSMLEYEYRKNHSGNKKQAEQPKPNTFTFDQFKKDYEAVGGYMTPEGEWK